ncbi:DUF2231 domain-containing protein [Curtobacterium sp. MCBD17_028]|uniref:DUF2231 domain-containing protein n=1 Tax=Curtobacterium sp. MCBD17_028 TaxID=2175670 RepID=UPI000DA9A4A4|nr:DUF2231 domain-containing protein [Curtobacterium sp. MCBD17_028]PZE27946.1 hypothetical protein DEI86_04955 [Curtobacterium sp. MCBD17_028]
MREIRALQSLTSAIEHASVLDKLIDVDVKAVKALVQPDALKQLLHGVPFGHPLHPLMVQVPLGAWLSSALLDLLPGTHRSSRTLVGVGVVSAGVATTAGLIDWSELDREQQRTGYVHAVVNGTAMTLYGLSWWQRKRGNHLRGKALGMLGLVVVSGGGYLGGHLSYRQRAGVSEHGEVPFERPPVGA